MDHVLIRRLDHLTGDAAAPSLRFGLEMRERPGPLHKTGAFPDDRVWIQLHGGLLVARALVRICWVGEYSRVQDVRSRVRGSALHDVEAFWRGRPRYGYAGVCELRREEWIEPLWAGPRTYGYEWVLLEDERKRAGWLEPKDPPRGGSRLLEDFRDWLAASSGL